METKFLGIAVILAVIVMSGMAVTEVSATREYNKVFPPYQVYPYIGDINGDGEVDFTHDGLYLMRHYYGCVGYEVIYDHPDIMNDGDFDYNDCLYLIRHTKNIPGYETLYPGLNVNPSYSFPDWTGSGDCIHWHGGRWNIF